VVIRHAVRSGQVVYAEGTDLIALGPVNPGAQLIADGNIHVYAPLRGRAVAGAKGYADARIFCQKLEAELIAINGAYVTFDDIPAERRGRPVQAFLQNGECVLAPL
jgi:septum site-determining protein MinC